jgi:hypothetical protein
MTSTAELEALGLQPARPPEVRPTLGVAARVRTALWVRRRGMVWLASILPVVAVVHAWGMARAPGLTDDEGTYVAQAWAITSEHHLAHYTYWYDHPPLGWIEIAIWNWLTVAGRRVDHAVLAGREVALVAAVVSTALVFLVARRLGMARGWAALGCGLFALCPLALSYQRLIILDNLAVPWLLASVGLALSPRRNLWAVAASGACFAAAVLTKETILAFLPLLLFVLWAHVDRRTRSFCLTAFGSGFVLLIIWYPLYATLKGELLPGRGHVSLFSAVRFQLITRTSSGSVLQASSAAHRTVAGWLKLDPFLLLLAAAAIPGALAVRNLRPIVLGLVLPAVLVVRGGYLPDAYIVAFLPFAALLVAGVMHHIWTSPTRIRQAVAGVLAAGMVVAVCGPWLRNDSALLTTDQVTPTWQAEGWLATHIDRQARIIVDDSIWVDLVRRGFNPKLGVVWFSKLDFTNNLDPSVQRAFPTGWRAFNYVVSTPIIRAALQDEPSGLQPVRSALSASSLVASFGSGPDVVEIRRVDPGRT